MNSRHVRTTRDGVKFSEKDDDWKRAARGFDEISSVFLSSTESDLSAERAPITTPLPSGSPLHFAVLCCLSPSPAVESFFAANLAVEIAKNNQTVTLIDYGFERSIVRHLMGCASPARDAFRPRSVVHPDYKVESVRLQVLPEITLVSPAIPREGNFPARTVERIFEEEKVRKCDAILINWPAGLDEAAVSQIFTRVRRAVLLVDGQLHSLAKAYSWIKKLSSGCGYYLIGTVPGPGEESNLVRQNVEKLQKTIFKHLRVGLVLRVVTVPLDREARISMQTGEPLALMDSPIRPSSADAIKKLCENLLRNE